MNFAIKHSCSYCKIAETTSTPRDYFLTCIQSTTYINIDLNRINKFLTLLETPKQLTAMILQGMQIYHSSSTSQLVHKEHNDIANIYEHQAAIS